MSKQGQVEEVVTGVASLLARLLILGAFALVVLQAISWLKTGQWQPLRLSDLFMDRQTRLFFHSVVGAAQLQPLDWIPPVANYASPDQLATAVAGSMLGLRSVVSGGVRNSVCEAFY